MQRKIIVVGSLNMDLIAKVTALPQKGSTILGQSYITSPGGKGANQAVAASRLGASVYMVGNVGNDKFGENLIKNLQKNHVNTEYLQKIDSPSGIALITVDEGGKNTIVVIPGANSTITKTLVTKALETLKKNDILITQLEIPLDIVVFALKTAYKKKAVTILNPSPAQKLTKKIMNYTTILIANEDEARIIAGSTKTTSTISVVKSLGTMGSKKSIITQGEKGSLLSINGTTKHFPALKVKAIDTTAAGDAFLGGIAAQLIKNVPLDQAVIYATRVGGLATTKIGAQSSLPDLKAMDRFIIHEN